MINNLNEIKFDKNILLEHQLLEIFLNAVPCGVIILNRFDLCKFFVNKELLKIFKNIKLDMSGKRLNRVKMEDIHSLNLYKANGEKLAYEDFPPIKSFKGENTEDLELMTKNTKTNEEKVVLINSSPVYSKSGDILASFTSILDITKFKKTEKDLIKLIKGKRVISQEFNNRLLNILYTTINLLQIDEEIDRKLNETQNKLNMIIIQYIHEKLSSYEDVEYVDFREYVEILYSEVFRINNKLAELEFEGSAPMTLDMLMLCGLVVNDIIAYRLSSLGHEKIRTFIRFDSNKGKITIKVVDDGPKMVIWTEYENNIPLKLAYELLEQISGFIKIETNELRTSFHVEVLYLEI
jgi:two-component sensor histidine kinase